MNQNGICRPLEVKNNISLSTTLPWWPDKAEKRKYFLPVPGHSFGIVLCKFNCRVVSVVSH